MTKSKVVWVASLAAAVLATPTASMAAWWSSNTVTLGAAVQITGFLADTGRYYRDGYNFAVDRINEKGGVTIDGKSYKLSLKLLDNKSDPRSTLGLYERLATKDKVNGLLSAYTSTEVLTGSSVAEKNQLPMIQAGGAAGRILSRGYKYVFGTLPTADDDFRSIVGMLEQLTPKAKTVALVSSDDSDSAPTAGTVALLKNAGMEIVLNQQYSERIPNFFNILTLVKGKSPDVLFWTGREAHAISYIRESKNRNVHPNLLASFVGMSPANFRTAVGKDANYAFGITPWMPSEQLKDRWFGDASQFTAAYQKKFGYAPDYHAAAAVAAVEAHVMAIEAAGTLDPKQVRDAIAKLDFESVYGRIHFGENGQILMPQTVIQVQDDKLIEVFTDKFVNQPVYPIPGWDKRS